MLRILITGANRGLGLEFVTQYLSRGEMVIATLRDKSEKSDLDALLSKYPENLLVIPLDVSSQESREIATDTIKSKYNHLDILINNAGMTGKRYLNLGELHNDDLLEVFNVNAISSLLITENLINLLEQSQNIAKVVNISSKMGSISARGNTNNFSYCASKAALNMFSKLMANSLRSKNIIVNPFHPGWVKTRMGTDQAPLNKKESISGMIKVIDSLTLEETGKFLDWQGNELDW